MKMSLATVGAGLLLSASLAQAGTVTTVLSDTGDSAAGWSYSNNGYKTSSTNNPGFGTGSYLTPNGSSYDDDIARALTSNAQLVAGGKVTLSFDYFANASTAYNLRFGIYSGSAMIKSTFPAWGGALTDANTTADWKGYLAALSIGSGVTDQLTTIQNTSGSNMLWGAWGNTSTTAKTTYSSNPARNDGVARTVIMELALSTSNILTINLYEGKKGLVSSTPNVTLTITDPNYILTNFEYIGLVMRANGATGASSNYIAIDNVTVTVDTPVPEAATLGLLGTSAGALLMGRGRRMIK